MLIPTTETDLVAAALVAAQADMPAAGFDSTNPFLKNRYASLGAVISAARPVLAKHGLAVSQPVTIADQSVTVKTTIIHKSGQSIDSGSMTMPINEEKGKSRVQVAGSLITYLRRYALTAALGMYADEDTDGNERSTPPERDHKDPGYAREPEEIISEWDAATPAPPAAATPPHTSPTQEKPPTSQPQAIKRATNATLHWALDQLKALDGEPNRPTIKAFLVAAGAIRADQEPENWRLNLVPVTPGQLRDLGVAIAKFDSGDPAVIPYAPKQSQWGEYVVPFGKFKDHKLGTVPEDVQKWFFHNFKLSDTWEKKNDDGTVTTIQKTEANKLKDRDFREALDAMGQEKGFTKEETTP